MRRRGEAVGERRPKCNPEIRHFARGGVQDPGATSVGSENLLMAYRHVAHDCRLGDKVILADAAKLAGHVPVDDWAVLGGVRPDRPVLPDRCHCSRRDQRRPGGLRPGARSIRNRNVRNTAQQAPDGLGLPDQPGDFSQLPGSSAGPDQARRHGNPVSGDVLAPEFIQSDCVPERLTAASRRFFDGASLRRDIDARYAGIHPSLRTDAEAAAGVIALIQARGLV